MSAAVFCIVKTSLQAEDIVNRLQMSGFSNEDISVLMPERAGTRQFAVQHHTKAPEGAVLGSTTGAVLGGTLGWLAGVGALAIPGLGPLIAAGPIMAALSGAAMGGAVGGLAGALVGLGIPEFEAQRYEERVKDGGTLICVHAEDCEECDRAEAIFQAAGGEDISKSHETSNADLHKKPR